MAFICRHAENIRDCSEAHDTVGSDGLTGDQWKRIVLWGEDRDTVLAEDVVEDIAFVFEGEQPSRKFLIEAMGTPVRTANRPSDVDMLRERKAERESFRRTFAGSKADLIDASFDALMGEC